MDKSSQSLDKLRRIRGLWAELERTKSGSPEYAALMEKIRALSAEYRGLAVSQDEPPKS